MRLFDKLLAIVRQEGIDRDVIEGQARAFLCSHVHASAFYGDCHPTLSRMSFRFYKKDYLNRSRLATVTVWGWGHVTASKYPKLMRKTFSKLFEECHDNS